MKHNYVPDGCFLLARMIFDSAIWRDDPHILKLFIYLVGKARYKTTPKKYPTFEVKHGELVTSLSQMAEDNEFLQQKAVRRWSRAKVSRMLKTLQDQGYITLISDTYGTHISICNYSLYQDLNNYKADNSETVVKQPCNGSETVPSIYKNGNKGEKGKKEKDIAPRDEPSEQMSEFLIPLKDGSEGEILTDFFNEMELTYGSVDIMAELKKARAWCLSNPEKRKTQRGLKKFVNGWMSRANDKPNGSGRDMFGGVL